MTDNTRTWLIHLIGGLLAGLAILAIASQLPARWLEPDADEYADSPW